MGGIESLVGRKLRVSVGLVALSATLVVIAVASASPPAPPLFAPAPGSPFAPSGCVGGCAGFGNPDPRSIQIADFNNDGKPDLIAGLANSDGDSTIWFGDGAGAFGRYTQSSLPGSRNGSCPFMGGVASPHAVATGDLDGDGWPDYVIADYCLNAVGVMINSQSNVFDNQPGPFYRYPRLAVARPVAVAIGDLNGDHQPDVVVASGSTGAISVFRATGGGNFAAPITLACGCGSLYSVAIGDLNGDGYPDVAVGSSGGIAWFPGDGSGGFGSAQGYSAVGAFTISIGDVNGDGHPDIVAGSDGGGVTILDGNGSGGFTPGPGLSPVSNSTSAFAALADLNKDGELDLVVANSGCCSGAHSVSVYLGDGTGGFTGAPGSPYEVGVNSFGQVGYPGSVAIGDLNGDGWPDIVVQTSTNAEGANVLLNAGAPKPTTLAVTVTDDTTAPVTGASVSACSDTGGCTSGVTDGTGLATLTMTEPSSGNATITVSPPTGSLVSATDGPFSLPLNATTSRSVTLHHVQAPPPNMHVTNSSPRGVPGGPPTVIIGQPISLAATGCHGGTATYSVTEGATVIVSGGMTESPPGHYSATSAPLPPSSHGAAVVTITITCPSPAQNQSASFDIYIDPSGTVVDTHGHPIAGATVTLSRSDSAGGPFTDVPNGSTIMSPGNRNNPDTTNAAGGFGWDVLAGYYVVTATAPGCFAPGNPSQPSVQTAVLPIPPPVTGLVLTLQCVPKLKVQLSDNHVQVGGALTLTVTALDASSHPETGFSGPVSLTDAASAVSFGSVSWTGGVGTATVTGAAPADGDTVTATVGSVSKTTGPFSVLGVDHFRFGDIPATVQLTRSFHVTVTAYDRRNEVVSNLGGPAAIGDLGSNVSLPASAWQHGVATVTATATSPGRHDRLTVSAGGTTGQSGQFDVLGLDHFSLSTVPSSLQLGGHFPLTITALTRTGEIFAPYSGGATIGDLRGAVSISPASWSNGVAVVTVTGTTAAKDDRITVTDPAVSGTAGQSSLFKILGIDHFSIANCPLVVDAGQIFTVQLIARDENGAFLPGYAGPFTASDLTGTVAVLGSPTWNGGVAIVTVRITARRAGDRITFRDTATGATGQTVAINVR